MKMYVACRSLNGGPFEPGDPTDDIIQARQDAHAPAEFGGVVTAYVDEYEVCDLCGDDESLEQIDGEDYCEYCAGEVRGREDDDCDVTDDPEEDIWSR